MLPTALLLASALATGVSAPDQADLEARVDALMADYSGDVPGASVLVVHDGSVVLRKAYGLADVENGIAATTLNRTGSRWRSPRCSPEGSPPA